jgi:hypothetical protein
MTASASNQTLTINGTGFQTAATVKVSYAGFSGALTVTSLTATQIVATINTGTTAQTWAVQVANSSTAVSNSASLTVNAPAPTPAITSLSPNPMTGSASNQTLTINGTGFVSGDAVKVGYTGFSGTLTIASLTATQILATIDTGTTARTWTVQVANSTGTASNSVSLTVSAPVVTTPAIASLSPNPMTGSASNQSLIIMGTGFASGDTVTATYAGGSVSRLQVLSVSANQIQASIATGTTARTWSVQVVNVNNVASNTASLTVTAPPPATKPLITAVSSLAAANTNQILTITGTGFTPGSGLGVVVGYDGSGYYYPIISATTTQIQVAIDPGKTPRQWEVEVIDSNGAISNVVTFQ